MNRSLPYFILLCLLLGQGFGHVAAQTTQTSIIGYVSDNARQPLPGATIRLRNESTGFSTGTVTNAKGEYTFKELPLGGPYTVQATAVGFGEKRLSGYMLNQGDLIRIDLSMQESSQELQVVDVVASGLKNKVENFGAATTVTSRTISTLPINGRNFTILTDLSPLAGQGGNLSGQLGSSTNFTIDGTTAKNPTSAGASNSRSGGPYTISLEAVREFKVITNQYDVVYGRAGGGIVSAVTKAGTNQLTGSVFNFLRANQLASRFDIRGNPRNVRFATNQFGFSLGGPIIKDKLHYFAVWERQIDSRPLFIADIQSPADVLRFNVTTPTLDRYVDIARRVYGVANTPQYGQFDRVRNSDAGFLRLDWQINQNNLLTVRNNFTSDRNKLGLIDNSPINIFESTGNDFNVDNSLLATLRTSVNPRLTNELKVQHLHTFQRSSPGDQLPERNIPRALVENVQSVVEGGGTRATTIQMGGHRFAQEGFTNNVVQLINNLYYNTDKAQFTFGVDLMYTHARSTFGSEVNGRFHFLNDATGSSLDNFERQRPYRYFREVPLKDDWSVRGGIWNAGVYGQMATKLAPGLDMTAGLRFDYARFPKATLNQAVLDGLGLRTDNRLRTFIAQPRLQFTWDVNEQRRDIIRLGAGIFASDINNYALINNLTFDGSNLATVDVRGADVPTPNFIAYRQDYNSIPTLRQFQLPTINMTGASARVPTLYKANVSYTRFINDRLKVTLSGFMSLARNNYTYLDRNMVDQPFFRLANEGNRGVFVPLNRMPPNGVANWLDGRKSTQLGRVLELTGDGRVNQFAAVVDATYRYFLDGEITASYTWSDVRDNTSYNGNVANTATLVQPVVDDPRNLSQMTYSDNQFRHKVVVFGTLPTFWGVSIGVRYSGLGGTRYTLLSGVNNNGDFVATNDLAFVFDRNGETTPANIRTGLQTLLDSPTASQSLKDYITTYSGRFAQRNGGINAFYGVIDIRAAKRFRIYRRHSIELSAEIFNFSNMLNRNWGVNNSLTTLALYAPGGTPATATAPAVPNFDAANARFNYRVNATGVPNPQNAPFQVQAGVRYNF